LSNWNNGGPSAQDTWFTLDNSGAITLGSDILVNSINVGHVGPNSGTNPADVVFNFGSSFVNVWLDVDVGFFGGLISSTPRAGRLTINSGRFNISNLNVGFADIFASADGFVTISNTTEFTTRGNVTVGSGTLRVQSGGALTIQDDFIVHNGSVTLAGGALSSERGYIGDVGTLAPTVTVDGAESQWNNSVGIYVGNAGNGTLRIEGGGKVTNQIGYIGTGSGATGTATVTGAGSEWNTALDLSVGYLGDGTLSVENGGKVTNRHAVVGFDVGGQGEATVTGPGSIWQHSGALTVGLRGAGSLRIENEGMVSDNEGYLGTEATATGQAIVTGAGSQWNNASNLFIGYLGTGDLDIEDGGKVANTYGYLGYEIGGKGTATITGANSLWANSRDLAVGQKSAGALHIEAGGKVTNDFGTLGVESGSSGIVTIAGASSLWHNSNVLRVGNSGTGTLNVQSAGTVTSGEGIIADLSGSNGVVTITGSGSAWNVNSDLGIAGHVSLDHAGGTGSLTITNSGAVNVVGITRSWTNGTVTVDGGTLSTGSLDRTLGTFNHHDGDVKINGGTYTQAPGALVVSGNTATANPSFQMLGGATQTTNAVEAVVVGSLSNQQGELIISGGSKLNNTGIGNLGTYGSHTVNRGTGYLGLNAGAIGAATVTGTSSEWNNASQLFVGRGGQGSLAIEQGGKVTNVAEAYVGYEASGVGTATITGAGSVWQNLALLLGSSGDGFLRLEDGGEVISSYAYMGYFPDGEGEATVTGANSRWQVSEQLTVGGANIATAAGRGTLSVDDRGLISVGGTLKLHPGGTLKGDGGTITGFVANSGVVAPGNSAGVLTIEGNFTQEAAGTLQIELGGPGPSDQDKLTVNGAVILAGTLDVSLIDGFIPIAGNSFDVLDWTILSGTFDTLNLPTLDPGLMWNASQLYTAGALLVAIAGDYNANGFVDAADYTVWRNSLNENGVTLAADGNGDNTIDNLDFEVWKLHYGESVAGAMQSNQNFNVPEPSAVVLFVVAAILNLVGVRSGRRCDRGN
jgi:T5SS/PEP-CTERM-associated repeat protein